jgi:flavin reductase (DIM6/NTAB) family NADH-FMN oxidoreductase RutF
MKKTPLDSAGLLFPTIATVATCVDANGKLNIITLGWAMKTSADPPMVAISVKPSRYSHDLIGDSGEFVLSIPTIDIVEEIHFCGRKSGRNVDKFKETRLTPLQAEKINAPLIKECPANLECKVVSQLTTGDHTIYVGEVVAAHVDEALYDGIRRCLDLDKASVIITHSDEYRVAGKVKAYKLNGNVMIP